MKSEMTPMIHFNKQPNYVTKKWKKERLTVIISKSDKENTHMQRNTHIET